MALGAITSTYEGTFSATVNIGNGQVAVFTLARAAE